MSHVIRCRRTAGGLIQWGIVSNQPPADDVQRTARARTRAAAPVIERVGEVFAAAGTRSPSSADLSATPCWVGSAPTSTSPRRRGPTTSRRLLGGWVDARWDVGRAFGTIGAMVGDWKLEITTYRSDSYDPELAQTRRRVR